MFKAFLCLLIICATSFVGCFYSHKLSKRKEILELFSLELSTSLTKIRYQSNTLANVFSDKFSGYVFNDESNFFLQWKDMLKYYDKTLKKEDVDLLLECGEKLGTSDINGETDNINMYIEMLTSKVAQAQNDIEKKSKLYRTLGLYSGIALTILLI